MNVMLLAAGEGTRLRPHTLILPKPAIPFLNLPLAAYALSFLGSHPVDKLVVNTFHLPEQIVTAFQRLGYPSRELLFSHEKKEILGSGGGLKQAENFLKSGGDFLLMNADEIILPKDPEVFGKAVEFHKKNKNYATIIVTKYPGVGTKFGGIWARGHEVLGFGKEPLAGSDFGWHFIGPQILSEQVFEFLPAGQASNILYDGLKAAIAAGKKVQIFPIECDWFETGNEVDFLEATQACLNYLVTQAPQGMHLRQLQKKFSSNFGASDLKQIDSAQFFGGDSARFEADSAMEGFVVAAKNTFIPSGCHLKNVVLGEGVQLPPSSRHENKIILKI